MAQSDSLSLGKDAVTKKKLYEAPWFVEKFRLAAGGFVPISNTSVQVGLTNGNAGTKIDFETDLGFSNSSGTFLADFQYRLTRRSRFDFSYYSISRSAVHTLTKDIDFADSTYHANSTVSSFFNTKIYRVSYGYSIVANRVGKIGALIGFSYCEFQCWVSGRRSNASLAYENTFTATAPLP